ncbi:MAG: hypothetical protein GF331_11135 [Chitinivibrionales bacterium]|nr:hypothetical protein [Chitinivibrionales bacterium]
MMKTVFATRYAAVVGLLSVACSADGIVSDGGTPEHRSEDVEAGVTWSKPPLRYMVEKTPAPRADTPSEALGSLREFEDAVWGGSSKDHRLVHAGGDSITYRTAERRYYYYPASGFMRILPASYGRLVDLSKCERPMSEPAEDWPAIVARLGDAGLLDAEKTVHKPGRPIYLKYAWGGGDSSDTAPPGGCTMVTWFAWERMIDGIPVSQPALRLGIGPSGEILGAELLWREITEETPGDVTPQDSDQIEGIMADVAAEAPPGLTVRVIDTRKVYLETNQQAGLREYQAGVLVEYLIASKVVPGRIHTAFFSDNSRIPTMERP